jgi:hypothetical protein
MDDSRVEMWMLKRDICTMLKLRLMSIPYVYKCTILLTLCGVYRWYRYGWDTHLAYWQIMSEQVLASIGSYNGEFPIEDIRRLYI